MSAVKHPGLRIEALDRLGVATRERADKATKALYLEDTAGVETRVFVEACRRLEKTATWFPKLKELLDACETVAKEFRMREEMNRPRLPPADEPTPERAREWLEKIRRIGESKRMPS